MPNQRDIANALGISQCAVSRALRGDPRISVEMRERVVAVAKSLGYSENPYVSALMSRIRSGRKASETGTIALIVDVLTEQEWHRQRVFELYYEGAMRRSAELGFGLDCFYLKTGITAGRLDRVLHSRGIRGVILAPPYRGNRVLPMQWERYSCIGTGYAWEEQQFDRVANDHHHNTLMACRKLSELGYERIGICLPSPLARSERTRYLPGFLTYQYGLPLERRLPVFEGTLGETFLADFHRWYAEWRPDVLLSFQGWPAEWRHAIYARIQKHIGIACLIRPFDSFYAGVEEASEQIGTTTVEQVVGKVLRNEYGPPSEPHLTLIEGKWKDGISLTAPTELSV